MHAIKRASCLLILICASAPAQGPAVTSQVVAHVHDSGLQGNLSTHAQIVYRYQIVQAGAEALRVFFSDLVLGPGDFLEVAAPSAAMPHRIDKLEAVKWRNSSAYFNGDRIELRLWLQPGSLGRFVTDRVDVGVPVIGVDSICGATDDRVPINDNRVCRVVSSGTASGGGCTGWLASIDDCGITAGHCVSCCTGVAEFNVPLSTSSGSIQHPPVQDQFPIDNSSIVSNAGGTGDDFAVYKILPNILGQSPAQLFGWFEMGSFFPAIGDTIRITGFGSGGGPLGPQFSQTNRTHTGPYVQTQGFRLRYAVDTSGGNSGSPVIHEATGKAVGVHTHAGCTSSGGSNSGTSFLNAAFTAAHQAMCAQTGFFFDLRTTGGGVRDLHMGLLNLPAGTVEGYSLFSFATALPTNSGPLLGLHADSATLAILALPGGSGDPLHFVAPFAPGAYPGAPLILPPGGVPFLAGTTVDGVVAALGPGASFLGATNVVRLTF